MKAHSRWPMDSAMVKGGKQLILVSENMIWWWSAPVLVGFLQLIFIGNSMDLTLVFLLLTIMTILEDTQSVMNFGTKAACIW